MENLERDFQEATTKRILPAVLLAAGSSDGSLDYFKSFGNLSLEEGSSPASSESTLCLASATKLATCVAAMQCVERGLVNLDDDISQHLPEWKDALILKGFDEKNGGKPILVKAKNTITLRHLLSHTSGITGVENEQIMMYYGSMGNDRATVIPRYFMTDDAEVKAKALVELREIMGSISVEPLMFEPGTQWNYGQSTDWAGQLVERVTHMTLEDYCQQNIFKPLGMAHTTYRLLNHPLIAANLIKMTSRNKDGTVSNVNSIYPIDPKMDLGGSNLYTSGPDFLKLLISLLRNDGTLLRPETADIMFDYRLPDTEEFRKYKTEAEELKDTFGEMAPEGTTADHCLAGMVVMGDLKGGRKAGSVNWAGATRCFWWIDRTAGVCGFYGSQIMAMGEQQISTEFFRRFEKAIYEKYHQRT